MRKRRKEKQQQQTRSGMWTLVVHPVSNKLCVFFSTLYMQQLQLMTNECRKWVISAAAFAFASAFAFGWWLKKRFGTYFSPPKL
jgi:hypothetical protein